VPQPLLTLQHLNTGNPLQPVRLTSASPTLFGASFGSDETSGGDWTGSSLNRSHNKGRLIHYKGDVYCWGGNELRRYNVGGDTWTLVHTFTNASATTLTAKTGLWQFFDGTNAPLLCGAYLSDNTIATRTYVGFTFDGTTVTETSATQVGGTSQGGGDDDLGPGRGVILWNNILYWFANGPGASAHMALHSFDPINSTFNWINGADVVRDGTGFYGVATTVWNNKLYWVIQGVSGAAGDGWTLVRLTGGAWEVVATHNVGTNAGDAHPALFVDPNTDDLFVLLWDRSSGATQGWSLLRYTDDGDGNISLAGDRTADLPSLLQFPNIAVDPNGDRWWSFHDTQTSAGSSPIVLLYHATSGALGATFDLYNWPGANTAFGAVVDTGGSAAYAVPKEGFGGGGRIFTVGELDATINGKIPVFGGQQLSFSAWNDAGAVDKIVKFYFSPDGEAPFTQCTLTGTPIVVSGPGAAPSRNGNQLEAVEADDGATVYATVWDTATDNVLAGARVSLFAQIGV